MVGSMEPRAKPKETTFPPALRNEICTIILGVCILHYEKIILILKKKKKINKYCTIYGFKMAAK